MIGRAQLDTKPLDEKGRGSKVAAAVLHPRMTVELLRVARERVVWARVACERVRARGAGRTRERWARGGVHAWDVFDLPGREGTSWPR